MTIIGDGKYHFACRAALLGGGCLAALALSTAAFAADAAPTAPDATAATAQDITVTGFRASLKSALSVKRKDIRISDGISSEDIGKFPAENLTEAIQRIVGVQMSNINGRGSTISIRGLGAQYARTTVNGQTFASADFLDGFRYDIIQTDMASSIQVIKSPTADMDTGGLSGTVNIETVHPLDYHGSRFTVTAKGYDSTFRGGVTPKVSAGYVDHFADNTIGVMIDVGYQQLKDRGDYAFIDRWTTATAADGSTVTAPNRFRYRRIDRNTQQIMASGAIEYRPSSDFDMLFQGEFSRDHTTYNTEQLVFGKFGSSNITVNHATAGIADDISIANVTMDNNDQLEKRDLQTQAYTLSTNWTPGDGWKVRAVGHYTVGTAHLYEWASIDEVGMGASTLNMENASNVAFNTSSLTSGSQYTTANRTWFAFVDGAYHFQTSKEAAGQFDVTHDLNFSVFKSLVFGAKFHHESFKTDAYRHDRDGDVTDTTDYPEYAWIPSITGTGTPVTNFLEGSMSGLPSSFLSVNAGTWQSILAQHGITVPVTADPSNTYRVDRYIPAVYLMTNIDTTLFGKTLRGNLGVRYEHTHQNVTSNLVDGNNALLGVAHTVQNYGNVLPSLNLALDVTNHFVTRLAAAKVLVRPLLNSNTVMADTVSTGTGASNRPYVSVAYGEQLLKPLTANQVDLSFEYYYGNGNAITLAGFYKGIKNGTYTSYFCPSSYNGVALTGTATECTSADGKVDYSFSRVLNDSETINIKGVEFGVSQNFDRFLPVKGFGFTGNVTVVDPDAVTLGNGFHLRDLSKLTWNLTPYWENNTYSVRLSVNHRSSYEQDYADSFFAGYGYTHVVRARTQFDLALGYTPSKHLSFTGGIINLNDSHEDAYYQNTAIFQMASRTGRTFYVSATSKF